MEAHFDTVGLKLRVISLVRDRKRLVLEFTDDGSDFEGRLLAALPTLLRLQSPPPAASTADASSSTSANEEA